MFSTDALGLLKYMLMYYGLVFLAKEAVWEKLTETGKDRFDIVVSIGFGWTIFLYFTLEGILSVFNDSSKEIPYLYILLFFLITLSSYYSGKSITRRRKKKSQ